MGARISKITSTIFWMSFSYTPSATTFCVGLSQELWRERRTNGLWVRRPTHRQHHWVQRVVAHVHCPACGGDTDKKRGITRSSMWNSGAVLCENVDWFSKTMTNMKRLDLTIVLYVFKFGLQNHYLWLRYRCVRKGRFVYQEWVRWRKKKR